MEKYKDVWKFYKKRNKISVVAICNICEKNIACKGSSTSGLHRHLLLKHKMLYDKSGESHSDDIPTKRQRTTQKSVDEYLTVQPRETLNEIVAKLICKDGFTIRGITKSGFIRQSLKNKGLNFPKDPCRVRNFMINYFVEKRDEIIEKIKQFKADGRKFSISFDEWTSCSNSRYIDIQLYYNATDSDNLGLIRVKGSCPADVALKLVESKLTEFGLSLECDILSVATDGAKVMERFGRLSPAIQQLCYNHAIHLAVVEILYVKKAPLVLNDQVVNDEANNEDKLDYDLDLLVEQSNNIIDADVELEPNYAQTIKSIREIVLLFKNSPVRDFVLQKYVIQQEHEELKVLLDCKTRWNSIVTMIERFLRILDPIKKSLADLNFSFMLSENTIATARDILNILQPIQVAVETLSRRDSTVLTAEGVMKFPFKSIEKVDSPMAVEMINALKQKLGLRRNKVLVSLTKFLHNPNCLLNKQTDVFFKMSTKVDMIHLARTILSRVNNKHSAEEEIEGVCVPDVEIENVNHEPTNAAKENLKMLKEDVSSAIKESLEQYEPMVTDDNKYSTLNQEFNLYAASGIKSKNLQVLSEALSTVKITSTQNERNFSSSGNFVTKKRTSLSDETLNAMCFLKHYFLSNE